MYNEMADTYDRMYAFKDYRAEAEKLSVLIEPRLRSGGHRLLDVACGTGKHLEYLKGKFEVEGLDLSNEMLAQARARLPGVPLYQADMADFSLGRTYDVITCLFSSIGYLESLERVRQAAGCMASHLAPGGVLAVEPWFTPDTWKPGSVHVLHVDEPELKLARMNTSFVDGRRSYFDFHFLVGTPEGTRYFVEHHDLWLYTQEEMQAAFESAGLTVAYDAEGLDGRGIYLAVKPL